MTNKSRNSQSLFKALERARNGLWLPPASASNRQGSPARNGNGAGSAQPPLAQAPLSDSIASVLSAAALWIRKRRDARLRPNPRVATAILEKIGADNPTVLAAHRVAVIVAHPDDEAIGAGSVLRDFPDVTVVHVTDGAPNDEGYAQTKGFVSREEYARARRAEVVAALDVIGIPPSRIRGLGFVDGEASWHLVELCHKVADLLDDLQPDVVLTHPYEGGHSDHDSTAFAVHLAAGILQREGLPAPIILELTSYHNYQGKRRLFDFLPTWGAPVKTVQLSPEDREIKRQMFELFTSQLALLKTFPIEVERFRQAPRYLFTVPPHEGQLDYERLCKKMTGTEWRANAERALQLLRSKRQFTGSGEFSRDGLISGTG
jgi:LmbE family N-acetylglucosaminyl deacetylase